MKKLLILPFPSRSKPVLEFLAFLRLINRDHIKDHKHYLDKTQIEFLGFRHKYFLFGLNQICVYP